MTNASSSQQSEERPSGTEAVSPPPETLKRPREDSVEAEEPSSPPPCKTAKVTYSIMSILAKDKKSNKENSLETEPASPPAPPADSQTQPINPFLVNPFLAAAAAAAQSGHSSLLNNISNMALMSKNQSADMWPWFNMAAMSALYGLDKGQYTGLFSSVDNNSHLRSVAGGQSNQFGHVTAKSDEQAVLRANQIHHQLGKYEHVNRSGSQSSSSSTSPASKYGGGDEGAKAESRKLLNRSLDEEEEQANRLGFSGASMGDEDELDDDDEDIDGSNNGDSFDNMRKKKTRTVFSRNQVFQLESTFDMKRYLSSSERSSLANSLQLTETQIKIWFQNRRNKWKRQLAAEIEASSSTNQHQQTQHQLSVSSSGSQRSSIGSANQRLVRVPVLYQTEGQRPLMMGQQDAAEHVQSSSSSTHSSLASPSNSANPASLLSPSMLAAAAAASSLYYAAAAHAQPGQFHNFNLNMANTTANSNQHKQSISSIL